MKIRWTRGSVRLRITPQELECLSGGAAVEEVLALPGGSWRVVLRAGAARANLALAGSTLRLDLSNDDFERLRAPDAEGVYFEGPGATAVRYYVEKDFPCAHPRAADAHDEPATGTFPRLESEAVGSR